jgi:cobalt/nickel transport system permease protein
MSETTQHKENAMHIPDSMLQGSICPVTATVSTAGIIAAAYFGHKAKDKPSAARFGAVTALIFAGQMMNFPIMDGTSGHLLGGVLAASLLGTPFGVLAIALVVTIQGLVFSDGGVTVLGANIFNMAILGAGAGGMLRAALAGRWRGVFGSYAATALAAWASVLLASFAVSAELAADGQIAFFKVLPAMLGTHALTGIGEAAITVAGCLLFAGKTAPAGIATRQAAAPLTAAAVIALMLSPFASGFPDGLEWVGRKYHFLHESAPAFAGPLSDYAFPWVGNEILSTGVAGLMGVIISFGVAWIMLRLTGVPTSGQRIR